MRSRALREQDGAALVREVQQGQIRHVQWQHELQRVRSRPCVDGLRGGQVQQMRANVSSAAGMRFGGQARSSQRLKAASARLAGAPNRASSAAPSASARAAGDEGDARLASPSSNSCDACAL